MPASQDSQPSALDLSHVQRESTSAGVDLLTRLTSSGTANSSRNMDENCGAARPGPSRLDSGASSTSQQQYRRGNNTKQNSYSTMSRSKSSQSTANFPSAKGKAKASGGSFGADVRGLFGHIQVRDEDMDAKPSAWEAEMDRLLGVGGNRTKAKGKAKSSASRSRKVVQKDDTTRSMGRNSMVQKSNSFSAPSGVGLSDADKGRKRSLSLERETASRARHEPDHTRMQDSYKSVYSRTNKSTVRSEHSREHVPASHYRDPSENPGKQVNPPRGLKRAAEDPPDEPLQHPHIRTFQLPERPKSSSDALFDSLFDYSDDDNHPSANPALERLHALRNGPRTGPKTYKPLHDAPFEVDVAKKKKTGLLELEPFPTMRLSPHVPAFSSPSPPPPTSRELLRSRSARKLYPHPARDEPEVIDISDDDNAPSAVAPVRRETCKSHLPETIDLSNAEEYGDLDLGSDNDVIDLT